MKKAGFFNFFLFFFILVFASHAQGRGSIPEALLRPGWGESPRYPVDIVIGELGQGRAPTAAYIYAGLLAQGLLSGQMSHNALTSINPALRENYLSQLSGISARSYRLGGGRREPDGAVSFLVRFMGRDYGLTGELYVRLSALQTEDENETWVFDELVLEEAKSLEAALREALNRPDNFLYEGFF